MGVHTVVGLSYEQLFHKSNHIEESLSRPLEGLEAASMLEFGDGLYWAQMKMPGVFDVY